MPPTKKRGKTSSEDVAGQGGSEEADEDSIDVPDTQPQEVSPAVARVASKNRTVKCRGLETGSSMIARQMYYYEQDVVQNYPEHVVSILANGKKLVRLG